MDLLVFFVMYIISIALVLFIDYYKRLFTGDKEEFKKKEIIEFRHILEIEWKRFFAEDTRPMSYYTFALASLVGFLVTYMGGLYNAHYESYFFHSAVIPLVMFYILPNMKDSLVDDDQAVLFWQKLLQNDSLLFAGLSYSIAAQTLSVYGLYHAISFLWVFANVAIIFALILIRTWQNEGIIGSPREILGRGGVKKK